MLFLRQLTPQQLRKCHILPKNEALSNSTIVSKNWYSSLYLHTFSLVWSGEGLCDSYLETFEEMLKPLSVDTNYLECGHKLGSNSSLFGGWIDLRLHTHSQVDGPKIFRQCSHLVFVPLMTIMNRNDKEAVRQLLLAAVAVPGALWGTSCLFLVFIGSSIWQRLIIFSHRQSFKWGRQTIFLKSLCFPHVGCCIRIDDWGHFRVTTKFKPHQIWQQ